MDDVYDSLFILTHNIQLSCSEDMYLSSSVSDIPDISYHVLLPIFSLCLSIIVLFFANLSSLVLPLK